MPEPRKVALIIDAAKPYDRKVIQGVAAYVQQRGGWSLYVEEDAVNKLPDFRIWGGHGVIANFDARKVAKVVGGLDLPVVGVGGGYGWYDPSTRIPYFASDNEKVTQLAADHLIDRGFRRNVLPAAGRRGPQCDCLRKQAVLFRRVLPCRHSSQCPDDDCFGAFRVADLASDGYACCGSMRVRSGEASLAALRAGLARLTEDVFERFASEFGGKGKHRCAGKWTTRPLLPP